MTAAVHIRPEAPGDAGAIVAVVQQAFAGHPFSQQTEGAIVDALRRDGALTLSLVAERAALGGREDGDLCGHVAFSPVTVGDGRGGWYGLGPLAVAPPMQRQGIGSALVREGLARLRAPGAAGCVVLGDPAFYRRLGFGQLPALWLAGVPAEHFLAIVLDAAPPPRGEVHYHRSFGV